MEKLFPLTYREERDCKPTRERFIQFLHDTHWAHFVARRNPPWLGVNQCIVCLQYSHYHPSGDRDDSFNISTVMWGQEEWFVVSIPDKDVHLMEDIAEGSGLEVMQGRPARGTGEMFSCFPYDSPKMYLLEPQRRFMERIHDSLVFRQFVLQEQLTIQYILGEAPAVYLT